MTSVSELEKALREAYRRESSRGARGRERDIFRMLMMVLLFLGSLLCLSYVCAFPDFLAESSKTTCSSQISFNPTGQMQTEPFPATPFRDEMKRKVSLDIYV